MQKALIAAPGAEPAVALIQRGACTFEQKAAIAAAVGTTR